MAVPETPSDIPSFAEGMRAVAAVQTACSDEFTDSVTSVEAGEASHAIASAFPRRKIPESAGSALFEEKIGVVTEVLPVTVVNVPAAGVVAPTVPLILIDAVPVRLVTVPEDGVPRAPPFTTNAPALPTLTPSAVNTPVPAPVSPVEIGRPVPLVRTTADGVPRFGVISVGDPAKTTPPDVPVSSVSEFKRKAEVAVVVACLPEPRKRAREAVKDEKVLLKPDSAASVTDRPAKVGEEAVVRFWPVLKASCVSPIESPAMEMTAPEAPITTGELVILICELPERVVVATFPSFAG